MIRPYHPGDTPSLVAIWTDASALAHPFLPADFIAGEADNLRNLYLPNAETWVAEVDGAPVGFVALLGAAIGGLFLVPAHHGRGLGRAMVDHAQALHGPLSVEVFARNAIGRRFYDRYGFAETGRYLHAPSGEITLTMAMPGA